MSEDSTPCKCNDPALTFCYVHKKWSTEAKRETERLRLARSTVDTVPGTRKARTKSSQKRKAVVSPDATADTERAPPDFDPDITAEWPSDDT